MARRISLTDEPHQRHPILFEQSQVFVTLRYMPTIEQWFLSAEYLDWKIDNQKLSVGVLHIRSQNQPFDFTVIDNSGNGLDPFRVNDFSSGRCTLIFFEADDMEAIRGVPVG